MNKSVSDLVNAVYGYMIESMSSLVNVICRYMINSMSGFVNEVCGYVIMSVIKSKGINCENMSSSAGFVAQILFQKENSPDHQRHVSVELS